MNAGQIYGQSIAFPPRVGPDGRMAWSVGDANIRESIEVILKTEPKERINLASFGGGLRQFLFEPNTVATRHQIEDRITRALEEWEPRITVTSVEVEEDERDVQAATATIHYQLVATRQSSQLALRVNLGS